jgi:hypothetical protein
MNKAEPDRLGEGEDWALAEAAATAAMTQRKLTRRIGDIQRKEDMLEPP